MTCRELVDFLAEYVSGGLPAAERLAFEQHLEVCADCRVYLAKYRQAVALGRDALHAEDGVAAADVPQPLIDAILASRRQT